MLKDGGFLFIGDENDLVGISEIACRDTLSLRVIRNKKRLNLQCLDLIHFQYGGLLTIRDKNFNIIFTLIDTWNSHSSVVY